MTTITYLLFFLCVSLVLILLSRENRERKLFHELEREHELRETAEQVADYNGLVAEHTASIAFNIEPPRYADGSTWRYGDIVEFTDSVSGRRREGCIILHVDKGGIVRDGKVLAIATDNRNFLPGQVSDVLKKGRRTGVVRIEKD